MMQHCAPRTAIRRGLAHVQYRDARYAAETAHRGPCFELQMNCGPRISPRGRWRNRPVIEFCGRAPFHTGCRLCY